MAIGTFESTTGFVASWIYELARMYDEVDHQDDVSFEARFVLSLVNERNVDPLVAAELFESAGRMLRLMGESCRRL